MNSIELYKILDFSDEVIEMLNDYGKDRQSEIPEEIAEMLMKRNEWDKGIQMLQEYLGNDTNGMKILWELLYLVENYSYKEYVSRGIPIEIFKETMKFCTRSMNEYYRDHNYYKFEKAWWFPREITLSEYRIGALEYEFVDGEQREISVHIPSDANMRKENILSSINAFYKFRNEFFPDWKNETLRCSSWLLMPDLKLWLKPDSHIVEFQKLFEIDRIDRESDGYMEWVFQGHSVVDEKLPEKTSLQRSLKKYLLSGKKFGEAAGHLQINSCGMVRKMRIGIDMGGTFVKYGIVNERNEILAKSSIPTDLSVSTEQLVKIIADGVEQLLADNHLCIEECEGVGIGTPGIIDDINGVILYSNNYRWENVPLIEYLKKYISVPMRIANDADAAALGEVYAGAAKDAENAVLLTLGTGVGTGVIMNKKIFHGYLAGGCTLGHMVIEYNGRQCTCGRKGCLEAYASANALLTMTREYMEDDSESVLYQMCQGDSERLNGKMIFDAAAGGDILAKKAVDEYEEYLACGIANIINIFRPSKVIIGGGVAAQGQNLTEPLQEKVNRLCFGGKYGQISEIVTSKLGNDAGIIGAANLF